MRTPFILLLLLLMPYLIFSQDSIVDTKNNLHVIVFHAKTPNNSIHSLWIDCQNPFVFECKDLDFNKIKYQVSGGTYKKREKNNEIDLIPFKDSTVVSFLRNDSIVYSFDIRARQIHGPCFDILPNDNGKLAKIKLDKLRKIKVSISCVNDYNRDLIIQPQFRILETKFQLLRKDNSGKTSTLIYETTNSSKLKELKKLANKNDVLYVEVKFSSLRYSYLKSKNLNETMYFTRKLVVE